MNEQMLRMRVKSALDVALALGKREPLLTEGFNPHRLWQTRAVLLAQECERLKSEHGKRIAEMKSARPLVLDWKDGEWTFDCDGHGNGCRLHPDDDNNTHGGAPHVHSEGCPIHGGAR